MLGGAPSPPQVIPALGNTRTHTHSFSSHLLLLLLLDPKMCFFFSEKKQEPLAKWRWRPIFIAVQYSFFIIVIGVVHKILLPLTHTHTLSRLSQLHTVFVRFSSYAKNNHFFIIIFSFAFQCCWFFLAFRIPKLQSIVWHVCVRSRTYGDGRIESGSKIVRPKCICMYVHWNVSKQFHLLSLVL